MMLVCCADRKYAMFSIVSIRADNNYNNHEQTEKRMRNLQAENIALRKEIYELKNKLEVADYIATQTDKEKKEGDIA